MFFLVFLIVTSAIASFYPVFATEIFSDGFENDFTPWTGTVGTPEISILEQEYFLDGYNSEAEIDVYGVIGNELFFGQNWLTSNIGWLLKANLTTKEKTVLYTGNRLAMWQGVIDGSLCWAAGEDRDTGNIWRAALARITMSGAEIARHPNTGDCNEFIGFMDDNTQFVVGERKSGGDTTGSSYLNGAGLWTIPKSTWDNTSTWSRVYEDTDLYEWFSIAKFGSTYYALLVPYSNGKWKVMKSTNLTTWTVDLDYRGQTLTYDYSGQLIHLGNKLALISPVQSDSKWHLFVLSTEGGSWTDYSLNIALASENAWVSAYYDSTIQRIIFLIARGTTTDHTIYSIKTDGTDLRTEVTNLQGTIGAFTPRMYEYCYKDGAVYYPICTYTSNTSYIGKVTKPVHHGSKSMAIDLDATEYVYKNLASSYANLFVRFYVRVTGLPSNLNSSADFIWLRDSGGNERVRAGYWRDSTGVYKWYLWVDGSGDLTYSETINPNQWYCIEAEFDANSDVHYLWRDGIQIITVNQATANTVQRIDIGSPVPYGEWTADGNFDCVVVADTYIEPEPSLDTTAPTYSNVAHNTTMTGQPCEFSCKLEDNVGLSKSRFSWNGTGSWTNETYVNHGGATPVWNNITKTLPSAGTKVGYRWYANDTSNNWLATPIFTLMIDGAKVLAVVYNEFADKEDYIPIVTVLKEQGAIVLNASYDLNPVEAWNNGITIVPNLTFEDVNVSEFEAIFITGGICWTENLELDPRNQTLYDLIRNAHDEVLVVSAICAAPRILARADIVEGRYGTGTDYGPAGVQTAWEEAGGIWAGVKDVVRDGIIITGSGYEPGGVKFRETLVPAIAERMAGYDLNLCVKDWDLTDNIQNALVYKDSDTPKLSDFNGWANWTNVKGKVEVKVKWYGFLVNNTFTIRMEGNRTINIQCKIFDITVTCQETLQGALLQNANVTIFNSTSTPSNKIRTGTTNAYGKVELVNIPNGTITIIVYDGQNNQIIGNVTRTITTEGQQETVTCNQNYVTANSEWKISQIQIVESLTPSNPLILMMIIGILIGWLKCLKQRSKMLRCKHRKTSRNQKGGMK